MSWVTTPAVLITFSQAITTHKAQSHNIFSMFTFTYLCILLSLTLSINAGGSHILNNLPFCTLAISSLLLISTLLLNIHHVKKKTWILLLLDLPFQYITDLHIYVCWNKMRMPVCELNFLYTSHTGETRYNTNIYIMHVWYLGLCSKGCPILKPGDDTVNMIKSHERPAPSSQLGLDYGELRSCPCHLNVTLLNMFACVQHIPHPL